MKKICLIGNSHAGPLYTAYREMADQAPVPFMFLAVPGGRFGGKGMYNIHRQGNLLAGFGHRPDGTEQVADLSHFDKIIIGGGFPPPQQFITLRDSRLSEQCCDAAIKDIGTDNHAMHVIRLIREITDAPMQVLTNVYPIGRKTQSRSQYETALADIRSFLDPFQADLIPQPDSTLTANFFTRDDCVVSNEDRHMNATGAKRVMAHLFSELSIAA